MPLAQSLLLGTVVLNSYHPQFPDVFPEGWAQCFGQDDYGLWQGIYIADIELRLRWIPPGEFLMGSPKDEPERFDDEGPQHRVRFAQGFWLSETACKQALWQAVLGENPSRFSDNPQNPVENVSRERAKDFIDRLNQKAPNFALRLPSEAEWEYACRAGTTTPFWFGTYLSMQEANYNGKYPYARGVKGKFRKKTVPVKTFRPNPWGLYQMHGNVWEWCEDSWHGNYQGAPDDGSAWTAGESKSTICRGGSWINNGRSLRSADRRNNPFGSVGFRFARGPELQAATAKSGGNEAAAGGTITAI